MIIEKSYTLATLGRYEEALAAADKAVLIEPSTYSYLAKGSSLEPLKRNKEALEAYQKAIDMDPTNPDAYFEKARLLNITGRYEEVYAALDRANQLNK
jgi:tetratricopeptide (TPR) repeat protein